MRNAPHHKAPGRDIQRNSVAPSRPARTTTNDNKQHAARTSRTKQETDLSSVAGAPSARVFATRGLDIRKEPDSAERLKKSSSQIEAKEKKLRPFQNGHSKSPVRIARTWTRPQPKSLDFGHLPAPSGGELKRRAQLQEYFPIHGEGRFRRGLAHMKTNISNFFVLVVLFFVGLVSGFLFSVQKAEYRFFFEISNRRKKRTTNTRKSAKKHPESQLGLFSNDLTTLNSLLGKSPPFLAWFCL